MFIKQYVEMLDESGHTTYFHIVFSVECWEIWEQFRWVLLEYLEHLVFY